MIRPLLLVAGIAMVAGSLVGCGNEPSGIITATYPQRPGSRKESYCVARVRMQCVSYKTKNVTTPAISDLMLRQDNGEIATVRVDGDDVEACQVGDRYPECEKG